MTDNQLLHRDLLECFRGNIIKIDDTGYFEAWITSSISFDIAVMQKYFDYANVRHEGSLRGPWTSKFMGRCKTQELTDILMSMFFTAQFTISNPPTQTL